MDKPITDPLVLTVDIGTSSIRAMLFDGHARAVVPYESRVETEVRTTPDGGVELDADAVVAGVATCIDQLLDAAGSLSGRIQAVASATLVGNLVGVSDEGRACTPVYTWADTRSTESAAELRAELDESAIHDRTGCLLRSSYLPAQIRWLRHTAPQLSRGVHRWMSLGEYLYSQLLGTAAISYSAASWTGLLDRRRLCWDRQLLAALDVREDQLSPLIDRDQPARGLLPAYAERWPTLAEIPWFPAIGDGAASSIGSGAIAPRQLALALGTSGAVRVTVEHEIEQIPPGLWVYRIDRHRSLIGGALSEGGNLWAWLGDTLDLEADEDALEAQLAALPPDSHGLTMLPFLAGERSPGWHGQARATITGLSLSTHPVQILHAGLESIGYRFALLTSLVAQAAPSATDVIASGGPLLNSSVWPQIIADILGKPLKVSAEAEATSRGVALLALQALGHIRSLDELPAAIGRSFEPNADHRSTYHAALLRHHRLYQRLVADDWMSSAQD